MSYPLISKTIPFELVLSSKVKAIHKIDSRLNRQDLLSGNINSDLYVVYNEVLFDKGYFESIDLYGYTKNLNGKLYIKSYLSTDMLPQDLEDYIEVNPRTKESEITYQGEDLILVERLDIHKSILDVFKYSYLYKFDYMTNSYRPLQNDSDIKLQYSKFRIREKIIQEAGDELDRIADYSKMIYFLLSKVSLTNEEKELFKPILDNLPSIESLKRAVTHEERVIDYLNNMRSK